MGRIQELIPELASMKKYPQNLFYEGNLALLQSPKVSIVGTRKPSQYARTLTYQLASLLSKSGVCIVSGGAMGIDAIAHSGAGSSNTIAVLPCAVEIKYPHINKNLLSDIEKNGLLLSQFEEGFQATPWSFVLRNEIVVALGEVLVVAEAELGGGSMRSVEFALGMGKEIFVLPHRLGESSGTNALLQEGKAKPLYDLEAFVSRFASTTLINTKNDPFLEFCKTNPNYDVALAKYPQRVFEAELSGEIKIENAKVFLV